MNKADVPQSDCPTFPVRRPLGREVFIIHFFSGVRRKGDIQWWAETSPVPDGMVLTAISVDIIFHEQRGDLSDEGMQCQWLDFILRACVAAVFIGPPCSTWSASRWRYYLQNDEGPRPTRNASLPFGFPSLRLREIRDVILGNVLLLFALDVLLLQLILGRICVIEHPAPGTDKVKQAAGIWNLQVMKQLKRYPAIQELSVYQGLFGAVSPKPTHLAVSNSPGAQDLLDACKTTEVLPPPLEMGKSKDNSALNTSQLKGVERSRLNRPALASNPRRSRRCTEQCLASTFCPFEWISSGCLVEARTLVANAGTSKLDANHTSKDPIAENKRVFAGFMYFWHQNVDLFF